MAGDLLHVSILAFDVYFYLCSEHLKLPLSLYPLSMFSSLLPLYWEVALQMPPTTIPSSYLRSSHPPRLRKVIDALVFSTHAFAVASAAEHESITVEPRESSFWTTWRVASTKLWTGRSIGCLPKVQAGFFELDSVYFNFRRRTLHRMLALNR